jgi:putative oxidoreductase
MVTAVRKVHLAKGPWVTEGGYEYNAVLIAAAAALASGPGGPSVDQLFGKKSWGAGGTVFALVAGVAASFVAVELGKRATPPAEPGSDSSEG